MNIAIAAGHHFLSPLIRFVRHSLSSSNAGFRSSFWPTASFPEVQQRRTQPLDFYNGEAGDNDKGEEGMQALNIAGVTEIRCGGTGRTPTCATVDLTTAYANQTGERFYLTTFLNLRNFTARVLCYLTMPCHRTNSAF